MDQKTYIKEVSRQLKCSKSKKREIEKQLESDILTAIERGETLDQICSRMGAPKELAKEFNENLPAEELKKAKRKKIYTIIAVIAGIFILLGILGYWLFPKPIPIEKSPFFDKEQLEIRVIEVVLALDAGDYEVLQSEYAEEVMIPYLTKEAMEQVKKNIGDEWGKQISFGNTYMMGIRQRGEEYVVVQVNVAYENANVTYTLSFNPEYKLIGLYMR